jgi:hypothetical protein
VVKESIHVHAGTVQYYVAYTVAEECSAIRLIDAFGSSQCFNSPVLMLQGAKIWPGPMDAIHPCLQHIQEVLGMVPLHSRPLPIAAWRLLMDFAAVEHSFCHNIIPYFHNAFVVLCVAPRITPSLATGSYADATA